MAQQYALMLKFYKGRQAELNFVQVLIEKLHEVFFSQNEKNREPYGCHVTNEHTKTNFGHVRHRQWEMTIRALSFQHIDQ